MLGPFGMGSGHLGWLDGHENLDKVKDTGKLKGKDWWKITTQSLASVGNADRKISDLAMCQ